MSTALWASPIIYLKGHFFLLVGSISLDNALGEKNGTEIKIKHLFLGKWRTSGCSYTEWQSCRGCHHGSDLIQVFLRYDKILTFFANEQGFSWLFVKLFVFRWSAAWHIFHSIACYFDFKVFTENNLLKSRPNRGNKEAQPMKPYISLSSYRLKLKFHFSPQVNKSGCSYS